ncbi:MAG: ribonuclease P protein component [bacterium]
MKGVLKKEGIKRVERIRKKAEFEKIFRSARRVNKKNLRIYYTHNDRKFSRFAVVTGRKLGKAVLRNRLKRIIREIYRRNKRLFGNEIDWIFIPKGKWEIISYSFIERILLDVINGIEERNSIKKR